MRSKITLSLVLIIFVISGCRKDDYEPEPSHKIIEFKGEFEQSSDDPLSPGDISILSVTEEASLSDDGTFKIESVENQKYQVFMATSTETGEIAYYGLSDPGTGEVLVNDSTTALGLLLINPYLFDSGQEQRRQYLDQVKKETKFPELIGAIALARKSDPHDPLNMDLQPQVYQLVNEIMMSAMENLGSGDPGTKYGSKFIEIYDGNGNDIFFYNYRHVFYAADISYTPYNEITKSLPLSRIEKVIEWKWWPPWEIGPVATDPTPIKYTLKDGNVKFEFYSFTDLDNDDTFTAKEQATALNTVFALVYSLDILAGISPAFNPDLADKSLVRILQNAPEFNNILISIHEGDTPAVLNSVFSLLVSEAGMSILKNYLKINVKDMYKEAVGAGLKAATRMLTAFGYLNEHVPFFYDLYRGPFYKNYFYTSTNGKLSLIGENEPPEVEIATSPSIGYKETEVTFSADYIDDYTPAADALYEWKWVEDGASDNDLWSAPASNPDTTLTLTGPGRMYLRVDDLMEGTDICIKYFPFYESVDKSRIIILSGSNLMAYDEFLEDSLGYYQDGPLKYVLTKSLEYLDLPGEEFYPGILNPATDLLVIDNGEEENDFWVIDKFLNNRLAIMNFVRKGGNLLFITSWPSGYESNYLPVQVIPSESDLVKVAGYSNREFIYGNQADITTLFAFDTIPENADVHLVNSRGEPLLMEIKYGQGNIICSAFRTGYYRYAWGYTYYDFHYPANITPFRYLIGASYK